MTDLTKIEALIDDLIGIAWAAGNDLESEDATRKECNQARAALLAAIGSRGVAVPQWISVKDRLPAMDTVVALLDEQRWMNTGSGGFDANWHGAGYLCEHGNKYWTVFGATRAQTLESVTHWMPLPSAPSAAADDRVSDELDAKRYRAVRENAYLIGVRWTPEEFDALAGEAMKESK